MKLAEIRAKVREKELPPSQKTCRGTGFRVLSGDFGPAAMANAHKDPYYESGASAVSSRPQPGQRSADSNS
eukprot:2450304-Prorocentrum_lima.AAC.1